MFGCVEVPADNITCDEDDVQREEEKESSMKQNFIFPDLHVKNNAASAIDKWLKD